MPAPVSSPAPPAPRATLNALQGLRAVAALLVVCDHSISTLITRAGRPDDLQLFAYFLGELGVAIFFVISGFVMMLSHGEDFERPGAAKVFMAKRIGRILPLYWLATGFYVAKLAAVHAPPSLAHLIESLLFLPHATATGFDYPVFSIGWTLNYEMAFYVLFALALFLRRGLGLAMVSGVFVALVALRAGGVIRPPELAAYYGEPIVLLFVGGVLLGLARPWVAARLARPKGFYVTGLLALAAVGAAVAIGAGGDPHALGRALAIAACVMTAVAVCAFAEEGEGGGWVRALAKSLGDATYSIYLTHIFVLGVAGRLAARLTPDIPFAAFIALMIPASCFAGVMIYRYVERPLVKGFGGVLTQWATRTDKGRTRPA